MLGDKNRDLISQTANKTKKVPTDEPSAGTPS